MICILGETRAGHIWNFLSNVQRVAYDLLFPLPLNISIQGFIGTRGFLSTQGFATEGEGSQESLNITGYILAHL